MHQRIRVTAGQGVVRYLTSQWSERDGSRRRAVPGIFGIFGHGNVCGVGPALEEEAGHGLSFHQPKSEQAMVHAAIGYARASNLLSTLACTASIGPGSTNLLTGAATATVNRVPVLLLPSDTFSHRRPDPVMQALEHPREADLTVNDAFRPLSAFFDRITRPEQLLTALPEAMRILLDPAETGAVTLSLHQDVQAEAYDYPASFFEPRTWRVSRRPPAEAELAAAVEAFRTCERPLLIAGGGVHYSEALPELAELSERLGVPVAETSAGKGALRGCALAVGGLGVTGTRAANDLAREADLILSVGSRLIDLTTGSHSLFQHPDVRFIGLNVVPRDAHKLGAFPLVSDAKLGLRALTDALAADGWRAADEWRERALAERNRWDHDLAEDLRPREGERMTQGQALRVLNETATARDWLVVASGTPHVDIHKMWDSDRGERCLMEVGFSCMSGEIPAALGVRMAMPDADEIYVVIGDGTYLMGSTGELVTAGQEGLKLTVLVFENGGYQSIHALQRNRTGRSFGLEFRGPDGDYVDVDYAANARSLGCTAYHATTLEELRDALAAARRDSGPVVIVARVEPHRLMLDSGCWWDVGVAEVSERRETRELAAEHALGRALQRFHTRTP
ncbi:MAG: 3D-(3,5/4)-trihydroxycyclohexane-1,2-dione acylhydrolase (decyclizing) [Thermoleophilaceae bacterium]|nr:3D-(3,5/4)-trihydroxycyclohexane-1,2-dione acylhydrolase (decyclizing) [Thermoleophilaceae bacterium]